jgi:hypothetical protein
MVSTPKGKTLKIICFVVLLYEEYKTNFDMRKILQQKGF